MRNLSVDVGDLERVGHPDAHRRLVHDLAVDRHGDGHRIRSSAEYRSFERCVERRPTGEGRRLGGIRPRRERSDRDPVDVVAGEREWIAVVDLEQFGRRRSGLRGRALRFGRRRRTGREHEHADDRTTTQMAQRSTSRHPSMMTVEHAAMAAPMSEPTGYRHFAHRNPRNPPAMSEPTGYRHFAHRNPGRGCDQEAVGRRCSSVRTSAKRSPCSLDTLQDVGGLEAQLDTVGGAPFDLVPGDRRRHGRIVAGPQRVRGDRGLVVGVLAPVDEHLAGPLDLGHHGGHPAGQLAFHHLADREGEVGGRLVGDTGRVERHVELEALRTRRLAPALPGRPSRAPPGRQRPPRSSRRSTSSGRDRSRTPACAGCRGRRRAPSARGVRSRRGSPPTPAPPAPRCGSTRCRPVDRQDPARRAPTRGGATGSASRRTRRGRCRRGSAGT